MSNIRQDQRDSQHSPSAHFRASLEQEVLHAFRRQSQFGLPRSMSKRRLWRTAATLALGLGIGVGGAVATAQVQSRQQQDSLLAAVDMKRTLAMMRLDLAEATYQDLLKAYKAGLRTESDVINAGHDLKIAEFALMRMELERAEIKTTSAAARDELWAPVVGGRDFVTERLKIDAGAALERQRSGEQRLQRSMDRAAAGLAADPGTTGTDPVTDLSQLETSANLLIMKMDLRRKFLAKEITEQQMPTRVQLLEVQWAVRELATKSEVAEERAKRVREQAKMGLATPIDVKRAELAALESTQDLLQVQKQLRLLQATTAVKKD